MMGAEESGGFGFGMHLPERDGIYADLLLLDLFLREKAAGRWPVSTAIAALPRARRAVVLPARSTSTSSAPRTPAIKRPAARRPARAARRPSSPASRSSRTDAARHERRLQVLRRRRLVAARPGVGHRAARPRLHGGDVAPTLRDAMLVAGERLVRGAMTARADVDEAARRVDKPWGHELIWAHTDRYVGKVLVIEAGRRLSLQRHEVKDESILVLSGRLRLYLEDDDGIVRVEELGPGEHRHVPTGRIHRYEAIERAELIEVSTPELDDVVRLEDDFGREGTNAPCARRTDDFRGVRAAPRVYPSVRRDRHHRSRCMTGRRPRERPCGRRR